MNELSRHNEATAVSRTSTPMAPRAVHQGQLTQSKPMVARAERNALSIPSKEIVIGKYAYHIDGYQLMNMIRRITQQIGEFNQNTDDPYAAYMTNALRNGRTEMANALQHHFKIYFSLENGISTFKFGV